MTPGDYLGPYRVVEPAHLDGAVWLARGPDETLLELDVYAADDPSFTSETQLSRDLGVARALRHPNIQRVVDAGIERKANYVVTEFNEGLRLPSLVEGLHRAGRVLPPWVVAYLLHGLACAVRQIQTYEGPDGRPLGTVGRPVHPGAVVLTRTGGVKLALLPTLERGPQQTWSGPASAYQSPEAVAGAALDGRSDLFGLGVIAWELLSDRLLFRKLKEPQRSAAIRAAEVPALPDTVPELLVVATLGCLARRPEERPAGGGALADLLAEGLLRHPEASADETRQLVALANSFVTPVRVQTALLGASALADTRLSPHPRAADEGGTAEAPRAPAQAPQDEDPFFDAARDVDGFRNERFEVLGRLGSGGMGEVYRVRDLELDEVVALKMLPRTGSAEAQSLDRLRREVRLARQIASDHVCRIYDIVDLGEGGRGLTMAVVDGTTLAQMMKVGLPLDYQRFTRWGADIASGLAAAHKLAIVHRDLKPENIMIRREDDRAVILDFGIARQHSASPGQDLRLTQRGIIMGTPLYMSPEQLGNGPLDGRSDLYALGLILAEIITGRVPRAAKDYADLLRLRAFEPEPYDIREVDPDVPPSLAEVVNRLLKSAADDRPASADVVLVALTSPDELSDDTRPSSVHGSGPLRPVTPAPAPLSLVALLVVAAIAVVGGAVIVAGWQDHPTPLAEPAETGPGERPERPGGAEPEAGSPGPARPNPGEPKPADEAPATKAETPPPPPEKVRDGWLPEPEEM